MSILSRIIGKLLRLPPATTFNIEVVKDLEVSMADSVVLLTDIYRPRGEQPLPTILIRTPYGRSGILSMIMGAKLMAERGFLVVFQSCRGTFGSGGQFANLHQEKSDGLSTVEWIKSQDWFNGDIATTGVSYLGYTQWAAAGELGSELKAMSLTVTSSAFYKQFYSGESFAFESHLGWSLMMRKAHESKVTIFGNDKGVKQASLILPIVDADEATSGAKIKTWHDAVQYSEPAYGFWKAADHSETVSKITAAMNWVGGWFDIFLPLMMTDFESSQKAGNKPYLLIGPWGHSALPLMFESLRQSITWNKAHLLNDKRYIRESPIRLFVMGSKVWKDFAEWPPVEAKPKSWYLEAGGILTTEDPPRSSPSKYRYDPADPTPNFGGPLMTNECGGQDNRQLEARSDVLVFTTKPMESDLEVIGHVKVELFIRSSLENTDFFARLCDVDSSGKSINICDGLLRLRPKRPEPESDGCTKVNIDLWPTAHCFKKGHRLRLQISSGAHPRYIRNTGSGEAIATAIQLKVAEQEIFHDPEHLSAIILSVMNE